MASVGVSVDFVPEGATVLDVGCGDGVVTNVLVDRGIKATGLDLASRALRFVRAPVVEGSSDALPFGERSFDCLIASNVPEHLPAGKFEGTVKELDRVAARAIILSFPHRDNLVLAQTRCGRCLSTFHASRHVRSIDVADVESWFSEFRVVEHRLAGDPWPYRSPLLQRLAQLVGNVWYRTPVVCPTCAYDVEPPRPQALVRAVNGALQALIGRVVGARLSQLVIVLERRGA